MRPLWLLLFSTVLFLLSGAAFGARCMKGFIINKQDCCHVYLGFFFKKLCLHADAQSRSIKTSKTFRKKSFECQGFCLDAVQSLWSDLCCIFILRPQGFFCGRNLHPPFGFWHSLVDTIYMCSYGFNVLSSLSSLCKPCIYPYDDFISGAANIFFHVRRNSSA